ncbi:MAG TPA: septum formation initiator family protein [Anseongella sp.]
MLERIKYILKNKYYLTFLLFLIWMLFLDRNDIITQVQHVVGLNRINQDKEYYQEEIKKINNDLHELKSNKKQLEKFARENYLMKKENEDIFIIVKEEEKK